MPDTNGHAAGVLEFLPNSFLVEIYGRRKEVEINFLGRRYRALIDSGAELSIVNRRYLKNSPEPNCLGLPRMFHPFGSTEVTLHTATGNPIIVAGEMDLTFRLGSGTFNIRAYSSRKHDAECNDREGLLETVWYENTALKKTNCKRREYMFTWTLMHVGQSPARGT